MGTNGNITDILFPKVTKKTQAQKTLTQETGKNAKEFLDILNNNKEAKTPQDISFSKHAVKRLEEREIKMDSDEFVKIREAMTKLKSKGSKDSLIVTKNGAFIVDVENSKIVTAMDKSNLGENVFTKIDSTMILD